MNAYSGSENSEADHTVILGAGLSGLAAGYTLTDAGLNTVILERSATVGGLSKTISHNGFLFDIGGHRFLTKNKKLEKFVVDLLEDEALEVSRKSKIYMLNRYFDYPLKPMNASWGMGLATTSRIILDYCKERCKGLLRKPEIISLEDWVVNQFGRKMFDLYFKEYSEKVWGIDCKNISQEWVAQRIRGLSLAKAIKNGFCKFSGRNLLTLSDHFYYPTKGIGQISEKLKERINTENKVLTETVVKKINHDHGRIRNVVINGRDTEQELRGSDFVSSIPLTTLINLLDPAPPPEVSNAANRLKFRDLVIVTLMLDRDKVTDLTWMYLPEKKIPLGRIHEPKNWSPHMAPEGKTHIVAEFFCFEGDEIWSASDQALQNITAEHLERLGFIKKSEVSDYCVLRRTKAYPLFEVGYTEHYKTILNYLQKFDNLHIIGRGGMFKYYNMDHAMESGIEIAQNIIHGRRQKNPAPLPLTMHAISDGAPQLNSSTICEA